MAPRMRSCSASRSPLWLQAETGLKAQKVAFGPMDLAERDAVVLCWARHVITKSMLGLSAEGQGVFLIFAAIARYLLRRSVERPPDQGGYGSLADENLGASPAPPRGSCP